MLKKIIIKNKILPVPVPIRTLNDALKWVEITFLNNETAITKVVLDGIDFLAGNSNFEKINLSSDSVLEFKIDAPEELVLQSLESMKDFSREIYKDIRFLAIQCWQLEKNERIQGFDGVIKDLFTIGELSDHMIELLDHNQIETAGVQAISILIKRVTISLQTSRKNEDWKECAKILLNRLEYLLKDMGNECEKMQMSILTLKSKKCLENLAEY